MRCTAVPTLLLSPPAASLTPLHLALPSHTGSQVLRAQGRLQTLRLDGYTWSFKQCTTTGCGPQLSAKEKRCIAQGISTYIEARSHIGQSAAHQSGSGSTEYR